MQKILFKGPNISMKNENPDIKEIKTLADLPSGTGSEYFINAHGSEFFYKPTDLGLWGKIKSYFMPEPSYLSISIFSDEGTTPVLDITLLNKIQNNTTANQCNIVHIFSCHSGAAQHHLDWIQGNMVLCTYNKASDANIMRLAQNNYDARTKNDFLLIEYIRDYFHLLVASDFSISYKLDDQIYSFSLSANKIKKMKSIAELPVFLHKEYKAFVKFYKNIHAKYHESYPEIFNLNIETKPKELTYDDLIRVFSRALTLETYYFNKFSLSKIETMLNQKGLYTDTSIGNAIEQGNSELLMCLLNYGNTKVSTYNLDKAIEKGDLAILKAVLEHSTIEVGSSNIYMAEETHNLDVIELVKKYYYSTIKTITSEENTIDTTLTVVEEVPVLGEGTEGV
ncbi:MAG TPA: hypothetical protein LFW11_06375 [Rickettsia endosymbiont of Proechinophthirus fluctus]|uniref:hypothetical protein n=1 Tax=Rickettsia endosymbiont of Proechinophthirus fluctus TaxID=1462733 RepID=UPI000789E5C7|nr:hypothetical protein [Rickettsia endosymbiont of Proechinophthirus fluctus]KYP98327.1 hypothetical protein BG75_05180 [Rickettsia endosymbiont of Proechinophthirus fluctus]HJD54931.1 hypothetical protein [Rickettsia endosymbiont of Proechinophthirus fluctus]